MLDMTCGWEMPEETLTPENTSASARTKPSSGTLGNIKGIQLSMNWKTSQCLYFFSVPSKTFSLVELDCKQLVHPLQT
jgi:hypothetical protein